MSDDAPKVDLAEYRAADEAIRKFKETLKAAAAYDVAGVLKDNRDLESGPMYAVDTLNRTRDDNAGYVNDAVDEVEYAVNNHKEFEASMSVPVKDVKEKQKKLLKAVDFIIKDLKPRIKAPKKGGKKTKKNRIVRRKTHGRRV